LHIGSFIPSNNIADCRREGDEGREGDNLTSLPLKTLPKPVTQQPELINTYTVNISALWYPAGA
jgi:hypothetical protein